MMVSRTDVNNLYLLKADKMHLVKARGILELIIKAIAVSLKEFWEKL